MTPEVLHEVERLKAVFTAIELEFKPAQGASSENIQKLENPSSVKIDEHLRSFWQYTDGSLQGSWFAYGDEDALLEDFTPCYFLSVSEALNSWAIFYPYDDAIYSEWHYDGSWGERDTQIQPTFLRHRLWLPFCEFNGGSTSIQFDADPTANGTYGQIIVYVHDPDQVDFVAPSFLEFFRLSNNILEKNLEDAEGLRDWLNW